MYDFRISGMGTNGFMNQIMQSSTDADLIIKDFENAIRAGYNPNEIKDQIFEQRGVNEKDLTDNDIARINRKVEQAYKSFMGGSR